MTAPTVLQAIPPQESRRKTPAIPQFQADYLRRFLAHTLDPAVGVMEFRIPESEFGRFNNITAAKKIHLTIGGYYDNANSLCVDAHRLKGVVGYITVNPVHRSLFDRTQNALKAKYSKSNDNDIPFLRWMFLDIDSVRPSGVSATDEELFHAIERRDKILEENPAIRQSSIWGTSGNGCWVLARVPDLPNTPENQDLLVKAQHCIAERYNTPYANVDLKCKNPSRIMCVPGTVKAKGTHTAERPWRLSTFDGEAGKPGELALWDIQAWTAERPDPASFLKLKGTVKGKGKGGSPSSATPPPWEGAAPASIEPGDPDAKKQAERNFALKALETEAGLVATAPQGEWNDQLNKAAVSLYSLVSSGVLKKSEVHAALVDASAQRGHTGHEVAKTIASGREHGLANPRDLSGVGLKAGQSTPNYWLQGYNGPPPAASDESVQPTGLVRYQLTDAGNSERYAALNGEFVRYVPQWGKWIAWDGTRWKIDIAQRAYHYSVRTARSILAEAAMAEDKEDCKAITDFSRASESKAKVDAMVAMASRIPEMVLPISCLDKHQWFLNLANGTLDLTSGNLRQHRRDDFLTQMSPVAFDPDARCPRWLQTLKVFLRDQELIDFWQRVCGYSLTGSTKDHFLGIAFGDGSNGKSTILETLMNVLGPDYAMKAPQGLLMARHHDSHPTELADFFSKRLVVAIETSEGRQLNEALIKELTGGDKMRARRMREDFWEFDPTHKVLLATNHRPVVRGQDRGIWRRIKLIPFEVTMSESEAVKGMSEILKAELPGILNWMLAGCLRWQEIGLSPPESVVFATEEYKAEQDTFGPFLEERCFVDPSVQVPAIELYRAYEAWAKECNYHVASLTKFGKMITEKGFRKDKGRSVTYFGIAVNSQFRQIATPLQSSEPMDFSE